MAKDEKKGGFFRVVLWIVIIYLVANFCYNNRPLYQLIWPETTVEAQKESVKEIKDKILDSVEETKNEVLKKETAVIPAEDKESLKKLIEQKADREEK